MSFQDVGKRNSQRPTATAGLQQNQTSRPASTGGWGIGGGGSGSVAQISESLTQYQVCVCLCVSLCAVDVFPAHVFGSIYLSPFTYLTGFVCTLVVSKQRNVGILEKIAQQLLTSTSSNRSARTELEQQ